MVWKELTSVTNVLADDDRPDDGSIKHLKNICQFLLGYTAQYTKQSPSFSLPWEPEIWQIDLWMQCKPCSRKKQGQCDLGHCSTK
jgi:hypothetical protein